MAALVAGMGDIYTEGHITFAHISLASVHLMSITTPIGQGKKIIPQEEALQGRNEDICREGAR